jgi:hypothetical protein
LQNDEKLVRLRIAILKKSRADDLKTMISYFDLNKIQKLKNNIEKETNEDKKKLLQVDLDALVAEQAGGRRRRKTHKKRHHKRKHTRRHRR